MTAADRFANVETAALLVGLACAFTWALYRLEQWATWQARQLRQWWAGRRRHPASCICDRCIYVSGEQAASMRKDPAGANHVRVLREADLHMKVNS